MSISNTATAVLCTLFAIGGSFSPVAAKPGPSVLGEVTITEGKKSGFFTEVILPLGGDQNIHYGVYARGYGDIGGGSPAGNAGGYVHFSQIPIQKCGLTLFGGVTVTEALFTAKSRLFCQF